METWETGPAEQLAGNNQPISKKRKKKQPQQHSADIVYYKGYTAVTMPSLSKVLKDVTEAIVGLQYVWEYRSPSQCVQPHYQCKLCVVSFTQHDIVAHVRGWKHCIRYLKKTHPDLAKFEEADGLGNAEVRLAARAAAAEVEKTEGRGQIKVLLKEPYLVAGFQKLHSAFPKPVPPPPPDQGMGPMGPPFGPGFHDSQFPGEYPPHGGPDFSSGGYDDYMSEPAYPDRGMGSGPNPGPGMGPSLGSGLGTGMGPGKSLGPGLGSVMGPGPSPLADRMGPGRNGYGSGGQMVEGLNSVYPKEYQENFKDRPMNKPNDRPGILGAAPQSNAPAWMKYLESFRIENEDDAQMVLKVTKKLTDVLMEYRLRTIPAVSTFVSPSMMSSDRSNSSPSLKRGRYSDNPSGPSRYPDGPQRYFN